jgi:hypothetical protein
VLRGGTWNNLDGLALSALSRALIGPFTELHNVGFRVAIVDAIPEPSTAFMTMLASGMMLVRRKR